MSGATVTVIDRSHGTRAARVRPRRAPAPTIRLIKRASLRDLQAMAEGRDAHGILELALKGDSQAQSGVVSSFGSESAVLLHLVAEIDPTTPILFLNTGKLFGETLRYRDRLQDELGLGDIRTLGPHPRRPREARSRRHAVVARHRRLLQFPQGDPAPPRA